MKKRIETKMKLKTESAKRETSEYCPAIRMAVGSNGLIYVPNITAEPEDIISLLGLISCLKDYIEEPCADNIYHVWPRPGFLECDIKNGDVTARFYYDTNKTRCVLLNGVRMVERSLKGLLNRSDFRGSIINGNDDNVSLDDWYSCVKNKKQNDHISGVGTHMVNKMALI